MEERKMENLSLDTFAPYGTVIGSREIVPDMSNPSFDYWHNEINMDSFDSKITCGYLNLKPKERIVSQMQRLPNSDEMYLSADNNESVIAVALNDPATDTPDLKTLRGFVIRNGMGVSVKKGVWHWAPFPLKKMCRFVLIVKDECFIEDQKELLIDGTHVFVKEFPAIRLV